MKFLSLIAGLLMPAAALSTSQADSTVTETITEDVQRAFEGLAGAAKALDHDRYFEHFDPASFTSLNADGTVFHSLDAFRDHYRAGVAALANYESLTFSNVKIDVIDAQTAILVNEYEAVVELTSGDLVTARGAGTQVWSKRSGNWKLVSVSSSAKP